METDVLEFRCNGIAVKDVVVKHGAVKHSEGIAGYFTRKAKVRKEQL